MSSRPCLQRCIPWKQKYPCRFFLQKQHRRRSEEQPPSRPQTSQRWQFMETSRLATQPAKASRALAAFRLATGHVYLHAHLHKAGADTDQGPWCNNGTTDARHLHMCATHAEHLAAHLQPPCVRWTARRMMEELPTAGVRRRRGTSSWNTNYIYKSLYYFHRAFFTVHKLHTNEMH